MAAVFAAAAIGQASATRAAETIQNISLSIDEPAYNLVGYPVTLRMTATSTDPLKYSLAIIDENGNIVAVRDFGDRQTWNWTPDRDGNYYLYATVVNLASGETATAEIVRQVPGLGLSAPAVYPTPHPLVYVYAAPPCDEGLYMAAYYIPLNGSRPFATAPPRPCHADRGVNIYLAGLRPDTFYGVIHALYDASGGGVGLGPWRSFTSGEAITLADTLAPIYGPVPAGQPDGTVLHTPIDPIGGDRRFPIATDLNGELIWWYDDPEISDSIQLVRPVAGGSFLALVGEAVVREVDLVGNVRRETSVEALNLKLALQGIEPITTLHHDARRLPNGYTALIANAERTFTDVQGPGEVSVLGDYIIVLDELLQVVWVWNGFEKLDVSRVATLGEQCVLPGGGCPLVIGGPVANDWMHSNAVSYTADGNLLLSVRHQDWVVKIDYQDGAGSGDVIWRLGPEGDFAIDSSEVYPWQSHQHDPNMIGDNYLVLYDNGNTRCQTVGLCYSRGQVYQLDEAGMTVALAINADLGNYSPAVGSAQMLSNNNFYFGSGFRRYDNSGLPSHATGDEVLADGNIAYSLYIDTPEYRTFRVNDLYSTPYGSP